MGFIGDRAFEDCSNLTSVFVNRKTPLVNNEINEIFYNFPKRIATLYVPVGSKAAYEATGWKEFGTIEEIYYNPILTAKSYSRTYGDANPTFEFDIVGGTVTGTPEITCTATATSDVGTYDIVITTGTITDPTVEYVNGTLAITKAPLKTILSNEECPFRRLQQTIQVLRMMRQMQY